MFVVTVLCALKALDIENFGQDIEKDWKVVGKSSWLTALVVWPSAA